MGYLLAGVTFVVVVCGNSNEKRKKKKTKTKRNQRNYFFPKKGGINIIFLYGTTKAMSTRIRFSFFFFPGLVYRPHVSGKNGHEKRIFQKRSPAWRF